MNNNEKIDYLNKIINKKNEYEYGGPKSLFKYRPFDEHTFDMLEKKYIYLCPAKNEDDETECMTTFDVNKLMNLETNHLKDECVDQIIKMIKPYSTQENYEIASKKIHEIARKDGTIPANFMLDLSLELQNIAQEYKELIPQVVNWIVNIPEKLDEPEISKQLMPLIITALDAREKTGICSLAEECNIDYMWKNYADHSSGYCIEYDLSSYELNKNVLPVIYQEARNTDIVIQMVGAFIGQMITTFSNGLIQADSSQFLRLFLTKYKKWEYQKEWRFIGEAHDKPKAPKIKCIYLGKSISDSNKCKMMDFAYKNNIRIVAL